METKKAHRISVVLAGIGIILVLLPAFDLFPDNQNGILFAGVICLIGSFLIRQLAK